MQLVEDLNRKTPDETREKQDFKALTDAIMVNNLKNKNEAVAFIDNKINEMNIWLKSNNSTSTFTILQISEKVAKLEKYKLWKELLIKLSD